MTTATYPEFKRGATFSPVVTYKTTDSSTNITSTVNLTGITISAKVASYDTGEVVEVLTVTKLNQSTNTGKFTIASSDTSAWPLGVLTSDIKLTDASGNVIYSETFLIPVVAPV